MPRKPPPGKSLAEVNPELSEEWHPTKNGELTPNNFSSGSDKKIWWICVKNKNHIWEASIYNRALKKTGCPYCNGKKIDESNSLASCYPDLLSEWHPTKNGNLDPKKIYKSSSKKIWWKCDKGFDHEWAASVRKRVDRGQGCPICYGTKVVKSNSLAYCYPDLTKEWHPTKNGNLNPENIYKSSSKRIWWKCDKGDDHEWQATLGHRINRGQGCPGCNGSKVVKSNSLAHCYPDLIKEWHPTKNKLKPIEIHHGSEKKAWWICSENKLHTYYSSIANRTRLSSGCPYCDGKKVDDSNSLLKTLPHLMREWHPTENIGLDPSKIFGGGSRKVWWKCEKADDHEWLAAIGKRKEGSGCPMCGGDVVVLSNCLATTHPKLALEWHPIKNLNLSPFDIVAGSTKKVWWKCTVNDSHEWQTSAVNRLSYRTNIDLTGCPYCTLTPQSRQELTITFELLTIFKGINPKGFKKRIDGTLYSIDIYIPKINIGIEFDGAYWHKNNQVKDKQKTLKIEETGLNLIRVRQKPLERLFEDDVMAEEKFDGKQITNDILKQIVKDNGKYSYTLDKRTLNKIDKYMNKDGLQNEKGLDKYIDQILTEKAERKKVK